MFIHFDVDKSGECDNCGHPGAMMHMAVLDSWSSLRLCPTVFVSASTAVVHATPDLRSSIAFSMVAIPQNWRDNSLGKPSRPPSYSSLKISNPPTSPVGRNGLSNGQGTPLKRDTLVPNSVAYPCRNHKCAIQRYVLASQS